MKIVELCAENIQDINKSIQPFEVIGRIKPSFCNGKWTYEEDIYTYSYLKMYPIPDDDFSAYIGNVNRTVFFAYQNEICIGQIVLKKDWNQYAFIEGLYVAKIARGNGVGIALLERAVSWAKESKLKGLALETQDINVLACRFYAKHGFKIGGINTMLYKNFEKPLSDEIAIFWYLSF